MKAFIERIEPSQNGVLGQGVPVEAIQGAVADDDLSALLDTL
jgi:hypothetical protein